jgi:hypothetical protein
MNSNANIGRACRMAAGLVAIISFVVISSVPALAGLSAPASTFVGKAGDCGTGYPAGARLSQAQWILGIGLPDNGGANSNPGTPSDNPNKTDNHYGLLLSKDGPDADCSAAGANMVGLGTITVDSGTTLGFDYRNGLHCGAGAPRFNVVAKLGSDTTFHFVGGCSNAVSTPAPQDPDHWSRVRFNLTDGSQSFPVVPVGAKILSISIVFDEGTAYPGSGLAIIDNIFIDGKTLTNQNKVIIEDLPE